MSTPPIAAYYTHDHNRLDELFAEYRKLKGSDPARARSCFAQFRTGLEQHIAWEEELLFPAFEAKTGVRTGPTVVMRHEHRQILAHLATIGSAIDGGGAASADEDQALVAVLAEHNWKEEQILYPAIDMNLSGDERQKTFESMGVKP